MTSGRQEGITMIFFSGCHTHRFGLRRTATESGSSVESMARIVRRGTGDDDPTRPSADVRASTSRKWRRIGAIDDQCDADE